MSSASSGQPDANTKATLKNNTSTTIISSSAAVIAAVIGAFVGYQSGSRSSGDGAPAEISVAELHVSDYLALDSIPLKKSSGGPNVFQAVATLKQPLPAGYTAWVATRHIDDEDSAGSSGTASPDVRASHFAAGLPCKIQDREVDCGQLYVGSEEQLGIYQVWILVTDSAGTQAFARTLRDGDWSQMPDAQSLPKFAQSAPVRFPRT